MELQFTDITKKPESEDLSGYETVLIIQDGKVRRVSIPILLKELVECLNMGTVVLDLSGYAKIEQLPKNTSDLNNDSGFITRMVMDLVNYYAKSETYNREEIDQKISAIPKFSIAVVDALPSEDISDTTIYLLKDSNDSGNLYTEYIWTDGKWEALGSQRVDLTGYAKEIWVTHLLADYQPKGNYLVAVPEGYAKTEDIPTKPEDIGAQPAGNYALKDEMPVVPVQSVNGKTGAVQLNAADVGARPSNWMPTAQEVGALPDTYVPPNQTAAQVGADPAGTAAAAVSTHNTSTDSHWDLRLELKAINDRLTAFFDSDNQTLDELSEIVAYITSNKALIDSITTSKVSVADIVNNLTTNVANKPLSAAQGVVLKGLIDAVSNSLSNYQPKGDYALRSELPTVPTKVSQLQNDKGYLTEHQDISGKLDTDKLPEAINTALAQAKESGEFDGEKGDPGVTPHIGTNGNWYIGSADTGVKAQGKDGAAGRGIKNIARTSGNGAAGTTDTYTITYTDNTTSTLTVYNGKNGTNGTSVTVTSVSESTADGGSNVVTFSDGKTLNVKNGSKGNKGDPGTTPQKGIDFWTPADQEAIVQQVITALGTPVFGRVDADNNIILTGELANGTYVLKYEDADGKLTEIGSVDIGGPAYTNQLPISTDTNDSIFNGTGYKVGYRLNSSSAVVAVGTAGASNPVFVTGFIPVTTGQTVYLKNCYIDTDGINGSQSSTETKNYYGEACSSLNILLCGADKVTKNSVSWVNAKTSEYFTLTPNSDGIVTEFKCNRADLGYIRMALAGNPANAIITVDQPITD